MVSFAPEHLHAITRYREFLGYNGNLAEADVYEGIFNLVMRNRQVRRGRRRRRRICQFRPRDLPGIRNESACFCHCDSSPFSELILTVGMDSRPSMTAGLGEVSGYGMGEIRAALYARVSSEQQAAAHTIES